MVRIGILGATGYTALELIKILLRHPEAEIVEVTSRREGDPSIASVHPSLVGRLDLPLTDLEPAELAERVDCVFGCLPHGVTADYVPALLDAGTRVIDLSADYRLDDGDVYERWYGQPHGDSGRLGQVPYGLPELYREQIASASLVANPGCYPTSAILGLAPLLAAKVIRGDDLIIDSKSGVSGAGRVPKLTTHYPECNESISAYNVGRHRHTPEIRQQLTAVYGGEVKLIFTPHLVPMDRGILTTAYAHPVDATTEDDLLAIMRKFYQTSPFVRVVEHLPATKDTLGTNFCDVTVRRVDDRIVVLSCIDNLIKGAAGAAVQNFNLMFNFPETTALY